MCFKILRLKGCLSVRLTVKVYRIKISRNKAYYFRQGPKTYVYIFICILLKHKKQKEKNKTKLVPMLLSKINRKKDDLKCNFSIFPINKITIALPAKYTKVTWY